MRLPDVDLTSAAVAFESGDEATFAKVMADLGIELSLVTLAHYTAPYQTDGLVREVLDLVYRALFRPEGFALGKIASWTVLAVRAGERVVVGIQRGLDEQPFPPKGWRIGRWYQDPIRNRPTVDAWAADPARATDSLVIPITRTPLAIEDQRGDDLLAAVCANPEDEVARLVYADWLAEQGDVRGELIRLSCELEQPIRDVERHLAMRAREREVLANCGRAIRAGVWFTQYARIRRGLVEFVQIEAIKLARHGRALVANHPITELHIVASSPSDFARLESLDFIERIPHIAIDAGRLDPIAFATSPRLARTRTLQLSNVEKGMQVLRFLQTAKLPAVERLVLSRLYLRNETFTELADPSRFPKLVALALAPPDFLHAAEDAFADSVRVVAQLARRPLKELTLDLWEMLDTRFARLLRAILTCETLTSLAIDNLSCGTESVRALASPRLERLRLTGVRVPAVTEMIMARRLPALQRLDLEIFSPSPGTTEDDDEHEDPPTAADRAALVAALLAHPIPEVRASNITFSVEELSALRRQMAFVC